MEHYNVPKRLRPQGFVMGGTEFVVGGGDFDYKLQLGVGPGDPEDETCPLISFQMVAYPLTGQTEAESKNLILSSVYQGMRPRASYDALYRYVEDALNPEPRHALTQLIVRRGRISLMFFNTRGEYFEQVELTGTYSQVGLHYCFELLIPNPSPDHISRARIEFHNVEAARIKVTEFCQECPLMCQTFSIHSDALDSNYRAYTSSITEY